MPPSSDEEEPSKAPKLAKGPPILSESAPSSVSGWSVTAPPAPSAKEMWKHELLQNKLERVRQQEREKAKALEEQCKELRAQLSAAKKRPRPSVTRKLPVEAPTEDEAPKKRPSPEPKPVGHLVDIMAGTSGEHDVQSDDEVAPPSPKTVPAELDHERVDVCQKFQELNSVVCAYKQLLIDPRDPKDVNFTFGVCAQMCEQEVADLAKWSDDVKERLHPAIISALHIVYPDKKESWYSKPFLQSPLGTADYWGKVLQRRAELWRVAERKQKQSKLTTPELRSVRQAAREKLRMRLKNKVVSLIPAMAGPTRSNPIPISSGSDTDDPTTSHVTPGGAPDSVTPPKQVKKTAPAPDSYTHGEMKSFARMARTIRNFDEQVGHSAATANFIDVEFSNNTGRASRCQRSTAAWKKTRFNTACQKAAKILEDRYMKFSRHIQLTPCSRHRATRLVTTPQGPPIQPRRLHQRRVPQEETSA